jgi:hypothetical protein
MKPSQGSVKALELALGRFSFDSTSHWSRAAYLGVGIGKAKFEEITGNIARPFVEGILGYRKDVFEFGLSLRVGMVNYYNLNEHFSNDFALEDYNNYFVIEPAVTIRTLSKNVKIQLQFQYSFNTIGLPEAPYLLALGLGFMFGRGGN